MSYHPFRFNQADPWIDAAPPATVATLATVHDKPTQSVATLASVAALRSRPEPEPEPYLDAWARLQVERPPDVSDDEWRLAVTDAGLFLDRWGSLAVGFGWSPDDLFGAPSDGSPGGLVWFLKGETVRALGPEHAITESGRLFDRGTRGDPRKN